MTFTELNSVEHYIIHQLSGTNLNQTDQPLHVADIQVRYGSLWQYKPSTDLNRVVNEVLLEPELYDALIRINPEIAARPERADEVIYKLRANEEFAKWLTGEKTILRIRGH